MNTAQDTYRMLDRTSLWDTANDCRRLLAQADIPFAIVGGVAVCLHGYRRNTVDVDLLIRKDDSPTIRQTLSAAGYLWDEKQVEFRGANGVPVQFLLAGDRAGKGSEVYLPDPSDEKVCDWIEDLPVLSLARLIETKIACGEGNPRRTHRDLADVVELIAVNRLDKTFARFLHKSLRATYKQLVDQARS